MRRLAWLLLAVVGGCGSGTDEGGDRPPLVVGPTCEEQYYHSSATANGDGSWTVVVRFNHAQIEPYIDDDGEPRDLVRRSCPAWINRGFRHPGIIVAKDAITYYATEVGVTPVW